MTSGGVEGTEATGAGSSVVRNETLYISNLNERVPLPQLKTELLSLCNEFGPVRDIVARKSLRKRGQAFVIFDSVNDASRALPILQDREWHSKPMRAVYARTKSDLHVSEEKLKVRKQKRALSRSRKESQSPCIEQKESVTTSRVPEERGEPNNVLFLEQIPDSVTPGALEETFRSIPGFREARMFAIKHVGFVEFESVDAAAIALDHWASVDTAPHVGRMVFAKK